MIFQCVAAIKELCFDSKKYSLAEILNAIRNNWDGFEDMRIEATKCHGWGDGSDESCSLANRFMKALVEWNNTDNYLGKKWLFGNLVGYNEHHKFFGDLTKATPDGRFDGDMLTFGIGQGGGKDREGLSALLNSVAKCDPYNILTGPSVTNIMLDEQLVKKDENFEKLVYMFETYFKMGGTHFQLTYVSKEDLIEAQKEPEKYKNLRVRVSGFSDYFVLLNKGLQDDILLRTEKRS